MADFPLDFFIAVRRGGYSSVTGCVLTQAIRPYGTTKLKSIFGKMKEKRKWPLRGSNPIHQLDIPQPLYHSTTSATPCKLLVLSI